jgi:hypothetical protein
MRYFDYVQHFLKTAPRNDLKETTSVGKIDKHLLFKKITFSLFLYIRDVNYGNTCTIEPKG